MVAVHQEVADRPERLFTRADYHAMFASGILREDERVELIDGRIIAMMPIGPRHAGSANRLIENLRDQYRKEAIIVAGNPVALGEKSEPQPDIAVLRPRADYYSSSHPAPDEVILLVEISDSTRNFDLIKKRDLYAAHGIREYWVIDGGRKCVHVFRHPRDGEFTDSHIYTGTETIPLPDCGDCTLTPVETGV